ncbi:MAG: NAD(P)-dependent oxidoreductase [Devosia sp.]|nr:NAD(P)-dependent oxidoreductase [Devosia sp.]
MKLLLTGASGFIGSAFLGAAIAAGHEVTAVGRDPGAWRLLPLAGRFVYIGADLGDADTIVAILRAAAPEVVMHLAWHGVSGRERNAPEQIGNIGWTTGLFEASARAGVRHFVAAGSQAEYGPRSGPIAPTDPTYPTTLYGEAKLATCRLLTRLAQGRDIRLSWLRVFSTYGPGDHPYWMLPSLIGSLLRGERPALTLGEQKWDFLNVSDAAQALLAVAASPSAGGIYNLGSGTARRLREIVTMVRDAIDPALPLGFGEIAYRDDQVMHLEADITRLTTELGWRPAVPLAEGIAATVKWYQANRWIFDAAA